MENLLEETPDQEQDKKDQVDPDTQDPVQENTTDIDQDPNGDITETLSEEVHEETTEKATDIDMDDFEVDSFEEPVKEQKEEKKESTSAGQGASTTPPAAKSEAVARAAKPGTIIIFADILLKRLGSTFSKRPKEYWGLSSEDKEDLTLLMSETIREGDFTNIPSKWLLIGVVALIIMAKVMNMNDPDYSPSGKKIANSEYEKIRIEAEAKAKVDKEVNVILKQVEALKEQNKTLMDLLTEMKSSKSGIDIAEIISETRNEKPEPVWNGYDLRKISFTDKGALIDPSMAGKPGYTPEGKKMGQISREHKELHKKWERWNEHFKKSYKAEVVQEMTA
jgi:hypothetical protein